MIQNKPTRIELAPWAALAGLLLALAVWGGIAWGQAATPAPGREVTPDEVNAVARELWCPLCSGVRLDSCELKACTQMKEMIALKLAEGEDVESIKRYFIAQYGPQVLGEPPREGFNWLAWILPVVAVIGGGFFFWRMTQRMMQTPPRATQPAAPARTPASADDDYERKLEEELAKHG
jgi:cytochrome c-type biogenesis protein CcmH